MKRWLGVFVALMATVAVADDGVQLAEKAIGAAGGSEKLLKLFSIKERFNFGETLNPKGTPRESILEPPGSWWLGKSERGQEPAKFVVWGWTLGILADPKTQLEDVPDITDNEQPLAGVKAQGTVTPPMELYFDKTNHRLVRIDWRGDIYRFQEWKDYDGTRYPTKCVIFKKASGKP